MNNPNLNYAIEYRFNKLWGAKCKAATDLILEQSVISNKSLSLLERKAIQMNDVYLLSMIDYIKLNYRRNGKSKRICLSESEPTIKEGENLFRKKFGERLKIIRNAHMLTQGEVARLLKLSRSAYAYYETGSTEPSLETLVNMSLVFNVTTDVLLGVDDEVKFRSV